MKFTVGTKIKVFDHLLFKDDISTPLSMTMQPARVIRDNYSRPDGEKMIDVRFDRPDRFTRVSHGHFIWAVEKIE